MKTSEVDIKISRILKKMGKAMPEIRRQVEFYERNIKLRIHKKPLVEVTKIQNV